MSQALHVDRLEGMDDPYAEMKKENIREALALDPSSKEMANNSNEPRLTAVRLAIGGNVMDFRVNKAFDLNRDRQQIINQEFANFDYPVFRKHLQSSSSIIYLGDHAGLSVFDRILIEEMGKPVTFIVREAPIINDVTKEDYILSGLDKVAEIRSSGSTAPGTILELCSPDFVNSLQHADIIVSKGQGNYERLSETDFSIFFRLHVKCPVIAGDIDVQEKDIILQYHSPYS